MHAKQGPKQADYGPNLLNELKATADRNGRYLWKLTAYGDIYATADKYTGTDYRAGTAEELLRWEKGYRTARR